MKISHFIQGHEIDLEELELPSSLGYISGKYKIKQGQGNQCRTL